MKKLSNSIKFIMKVAAGIEISYIIKFSPEAKIDYTYDLVVVTEREKFIVPIVAVGVFNLTNIY